MSKKDQGLRLYQAIERLCVQAGTDPDETVDWLCGEHGGMSKLFLKYFSPVQRNPLSGYINGAGINANDSPHIVIEKIERAIEASHGAKGDA